MRPDPPFGVVSMNIADPHSWPPRMLTTEVAEALRVSMRTFQRRYAAGRYDLKPVDRAAQLIWLRADVWRVMGYSAPIALSERPSGDKPTISPDGIRARQIAARRRKGS